ncbi:MAG: nuclease [Methanotrichaceae archaeon]|nr:nuclease [Methanotrichaceae archaeon]
MPVALAAPDEASGVVTRVIDGDTFEVQGFGTVRLADIDCPELGTADGSKAHAYATSWLQSNLVYLDVDDRTGQDKYGRWVCVAYLAKPDGSINLSRNFNRMLVDVGQACLWDFSNNEFDPASWWGGQIPGSACVKVNSGSTTTSAALFTTPYSSGSGSSSAGGKFVGSVKSNKYHYPSCEWGQKISPSNEIWFSSSADARAHGYVPCKVCCPP